MDGHKRNATVETENSIEWSTTKKKKIQPADKLIYESGAAEDIVTTNCSPLMYEIFSPLPSCVV